MSEYREQVVICDGCYPDFLPGFTFFRLENVKGVFRGTFEQAVEQEQWEERDYGHICPDCAKAEAEQNGDGEVFMGGDAIASVFQGDDDVRVQKEAPEVVS